MADEAKVIEKYKTLVAKMTGDAALVDKFIAGDATVTEEALLTRVSDTFWESHKNKPERVGALLQNARTEEAIKHKKAFLKALDLPESEFESFKEISDVFKQGRQRLEAELKKGVTEKSDTEAQVKLKLYEAELDAVRAEVKRLNDVELPLARDAAKQEIANYHRQQWFLGYAKKFETTIEDGFAKNAALEKIYGDIFGKYTLIEYTDGKFYLGDKKTGERISTGTLTYLTLDEMLVSKLREAGMFKESNAKDNRNPSPGGGDPPPKKTDLTDAQAEKIRKAEENLKRMNEARGNK
jgi:hypothetical protein